ncbi:MAG: NAD(P)/FAD-dependent oxidoreductase [Brasilonema sp.]
MNTEYDAIVVGGGIAGVSLAYHLVRQGVKTLLFDRKDEGRATDAGAGIIAPFTASNEIGFGSDALFNLAVESLEYYPTLLKQLDKQSDSSIYNKSGLLLVAVSEDELQKLEQAKSRVYQRLEKKRLSAEDNVRFLSGDEAREMFPGLGETKAAIYCRRSAQVDGKLFSQALYQAAEQQGLSVKSVEVERLILEGDTVKGVVANGETFRADKVAIAGGAWSKEFEKQLNIRIPVEPERGQIIHLNVANVNTANKPVLSTFTGCYFLAWPDNRIVLGATRESGAGFHTHTTVAGIHQLLDEALPVTPGLKDASLREIRVGLRPVPEDELPILGTVPNINNLYLATGLGHTGLANGPYIGKVVAEMMLGKESQTDIAAFNIQRFNEHR